MSDKEEYGLLVSFTDQSHSFTHGFEAGMIWQDMQNNVPRIDMMVHEENVQVICRMAEAAGYQCGMIGLDNNGLKVEGWRRLVATPIEGPRPETKLDYKGLRVIEGGK